MNSIPESYIRYGALTSALQCWALYGSILLTCGLTTLGIVSGVLPEPESIGMSNVGMMMIVLFVLWAIEALVYLVFFRGYFARWKADALQEAAAGVDDPGLLAQMAGVPQGSHEYYELVIRGYQDFTFGLGYTTVFLFFPGFFLGLLLAFPLCVPFAAAEGFGVLPEGSAFLIPLILGQPIAALLWYKLGFYRIYRRGQIKSLMRDGTLGIKAPRPGRYK